MLIKDLLPAGLQGLLIAAFLAAYMSTIASQTVWGTSYIINDFIRPFVNPAASEKTLLMVSRLTAAALMLASLVVTSHLSKISDAWKFILECSSGIGLVLILRWYWWRINAWSEIAALFAPFIAYPVIKYYGISFPDSLLYLVTWSTAAWLAATFATKPTDASTLSGFYLRVKPGGRGWRRIAKMHPEVEPSESYPKLFASWAAGCVMVMSALIGTGKLIFQEYTPGFLLLALSISMAYIIYRNTREAV
jgi:solute:Na+ symporter, SSS family